MKKISLFIFALTLLLCLPYWSQAIAPDPADFVTTWKTDNYGPTDDNQILIPATGNFNYLWENVANTAETGSGSGSGPTTITFPQAGTYRLSIQPTGSTPFHNIEFYQVSDDDKSKILAINNWGTISWSSFQFNGCSNLKITATDIPDLSGVTNLEFAFSHSGIESIPNINEWNMSTVTNLSNFFEGVTGFNQSLSKWNVSNVTDMSFMFDGATSFNQPLDSWDVSKLTFFDYMFRKATSFNQSLAAWNLESFVGSVGALINSGMSCENYSYTLYGWASNPNTNAGAMFHPWGSLAYSPNVVPYRDFLINSLKWNISGDALGTCSITLPGPPITPGTGNTLYVDINVNTTAASYTGAGDSWANAIPELANALKWAREQYDGGSPGWTQTNPLRIFVAVGTYLPLYSAADGQYTIDGGRDNCFVLVRNVQLYGGFDPLAGIKTLEDARILLDRNAFGKGSILSGDFLSNDNTDDFANHMENAYHVVIGSGEVGTARVDGFEVTGGNADGIGPLTVNGQDLRRENGGGMYNYYSSPKLTRMSIHNNAAKWGGGMYINESSPTLNHVSIRSNRSNTWGGGIYSIQSSAKLINVGIYNNTANDRGSGILHGSGIMEITNSTIAGNAPNTFNQSGVLELNNTIVWGDAGELRVASTNSIIEGSTNTDNGNIDATGLTAADIFVDPDNGDYTLKASSPAINAGNNTAYTDAGGNLADDIDLDGNSRLYKGIPDPDRIDIGAYEFQGELNTPPVAVDDEVAVTEDTPATGNALTNDSDVEGDALTAYLVTAPVNGTVVLNADGSFTYTPNANYNGRDSLTYQVCDNGTPSLCDTALVYFNVDGINDAPSIIAPATIAVDEDVRTPLTGISFADVDAGSGDVTATFSVASGTLSATSGSGVMVNGSGMSSLTLVGTIADLNSFVAASNLNFMTALNATSNMTLTVSIDDGGHTGTDPGNSGNGNSEADATTITLSITAVNDAPVNSVPTAQVVDQDDDLVFSAGNGNIISIIDVDAGGGTIRVTLTATNGLITLGSTTGLTFISGSGASDGTMTFEGSIVDINTALNGVTFVPTSGYNGTASLQIVTNDLGLTGSGGGQIDTDAIDISVNAINPKVTNVNAVSLDGIYKIADIITLTVSFDQAVVVDVAGGSPSLLLETGSTDRKATYMSGSGSNMLTFNYTVQTGDLSADLDYASNTALALNGATIKNTIGEDAVMTLPAVGGAGSIAGQHGVVVDGIAPAIPANFAAIAGNAENSLTWEANTENDLDSYKIYAGTANDPTILLTTIPAPGITYLHNALINGTTYYYRISAVDHVGNESPVSLSIFAKPMASQVITFDQPTTKTYGQETFDLVGSSDSGLALTYTSSDPTIASISGKTVNILKVGSVQITASQLGNVMVKSATPVTRSLDIHKTTLTITAENKEKFAGTANPPLTVKYDGFVLSETPEVLDKAPTLSTSATTSSPAGDYPILVSGAVASNYELIYVNGILKVRQGTPTDITMESTIVYENGPAKTKVGAFNSISGDPSATYTYSFVSGTGDTDNAWFSIEDNTLFTKNTLDFENKSMYSIRIKTTTQYGLSLEKAFTITITDVNEAPTLASISNSTICYTTASQIIPLTGISAGPEKNQTVTLSVKSDNPTLFQNLKVSDLGNEASLNYNIKGEMSGTANITITVTDDGGISNGGINTYSRTFVLTVNPLPVITINSNKGSDISKGDIVQLTAGGAASYIWTASNGIISGQHTATLTVRPIENTTYEVVGTNTTGCSEKQSFNIKVIEDFKLIANNIVTPNGDGYNDKWIVENIDIYQDNLVKIFDRAGRLLYTKKGYDNSWDATYNGNPLNEDTYYYVMEFTGSTRKFKGYITVVRQN